MTNEGVNIQQISCISVFRYINQLTKVLMRINIVFIIFLIWPPTANGSIYLKYQVLEVQRGHAPDIELTYKTNTLEMLKIIDKNCCFVENIGFIGHLLKI